jgi:hypothetical protein
MSMPKWFSDEGAPRKERNRRSKKQETGRAKEIGGRATAGSGSSYRAPQDVFNRDFLEQLKFTDKESFTIKLAEWEQLEADARRAGREPRWVQEMGGRRFIITEG